VAGFGPKTVLAEVGCTVAEALLKVHRSYLKPIRALMKAGLLKGAAHITGGGITDNTPRMLPKGLGAQIDTSSWNVPALFETLREIGDIPLDDYRRTLNLGAGMILTVGARGVSKAEQVLHRLGEKPWRIGTVVEVKRGKARVEYR
jgi:phosphoribosylformylglycinamidine cyclo-ligase